MENNNNKGGGMALPPSKIELVVQNQQNQRKKKKGSFNYDPKNKQVEEKKKKRNVLNSSSILLTDLEFTFCSHFGWDGTLVLLFMIGVAVFFILLFYFYTDFFRLVDRDWVWVFPTFSCAYVALTLRYLFGWKNIAKSFTEKILSEETIGTTMNTSNEEGERGKISICTRLGWCKSSFALEGRLFLWKLYFSEIAGIIVQTNNMASIFLCTLPIEITSVLCLLYCIEASHSVWTALLPNTPKRRDRQLKIDLFFSIIYISLPMLFPWLVYDVTIDMFHLYSIILYPTFSVLLVIDDILEGIVRNRSSLHVNKTQTRVSSRFSRRRESLFGVDVHLQNAKEQENAVPTLLKFGFVGSKIIFALFFFVIQIIHWVSYNSAGGKCGIDENSVQLWNGCNVKVPFCMNLVEAKCDCAFLTIKKHNMSTLPPAFSMMKSLQKASIYNGPLKHLPENIGLMLPRLAYLSIDFNKLRTLPPSLGAAKKLTRLYAQFNEITSIPKEIWQHKSLIELELGTNHIKSISEEINMEGLYILGLSNNSIKSFPPGIHHSVYLRDIYLDGNHLTSIPKEFSLLLKLEYLILSRNNLTASSFPLELKKMSHLNTFDLRNNSIVKLPCWFGEYENLETLLIHGNPACSNGWVDSMECSANLKDKIKREGQGCSQQCTAFCLETLLQYQGCVPQCNSKECGYSNGYCHKLYN